MASVQNPDSDKQLALVPAGAEAKQADSLARPTKQPAVFRRTVDAAHPCLNQHLRLLRRPGCRQHDHEALDPTAADSLKMLPPTGLVSQPLSACCTKFVHGSRYKARGALHALAWTPDGRRLLTGAASGSFSLWDGASFNFETMLQAHEAAVRVIRFSHNDNWLVSADGGGRVKYWKLNLELVKVIPAHREGVNSLAFSCSDLAFVTSSDDGTLKVWDFAQCISTSTLAGHGGDVKACDWHPRQSLVASGSRDALIKLWDARAGGAALHTLQVHKAAVSSLSWHPNGNWLLSASRDHLVKVFDARTLRELAAFRGHSKDVAAAAWHPWQQEAFVSGDFDGNLCHWLLSSPSPLAEIRNAHSGQIWTLAFHPMGHLLATGGYDGQTRFWCRSRPGDAWLDRAPRDLNNDVVAEGEGGVMGDSLGGDDIIPGIGGAAAPPSMAAFEMDPSVPEAPSAHEVSHEVQNAAKRPRSGAPPPARPTGFLGPQHAPAAQPRPPPMQFAPLQQGPALAGGHPAVQGQVPYGGRGPAPAYRPAVGMTPWPQTYPTRPPPRPPPGGHSGR